MAVLLGSFTAAAINIAVSSVVARLHGDTSAECITTVVLCKSFWTTPRQEWWKGRARDATASDDVGLYSLSGRVGVNIILMLRPCRAKLGCISFFLLGWASKPSINWFPSVMGLYFIGVSFLLIFQAGIK